MNVSSVPGEAITIYNNALELSNRGNLTDAISEYKKAISLHPSFIEAYNNIGEIYSRLGNNDEAIASYQDALSIEKDHRVLLNLGVEFFTKFDYEKALQYFLESIKLKPDYIEGNFYTGMIYYSEKNFETAKFYFLQVVRSDRKHVKANYLLSHIYYENQDYHKTLEHLDNIKDIAEDKSFINRYYGFCHYYLGNFTKAVDFLTTALESHPEYKRFSNYLKNLTYEKKLEEVGNIDKAIKELEKKMMKSKPQVKDATRLSMLYIFKGKNEKAEALIESVKKGMAS